MKKIFKIIIFLIVISIIVFFGYTQITPSPKPPKSPNITSSSPIAVSAQQRILKPGYYELTTDLAPTNITRAQNSNNTCTFFSIPSSDVVFDGMGHVIDGSQISQPCYTLNGFGGFGARDATEYQFNYIYKNIEDRFKYPRITVRNITIKNVETGFAFSNAHDVRIENVTFIDNHGGIFFQSSSYVYIINNTFINTAGTAIQGNDNEEVTIYNNKIINSRDGMLFQGIKGASPSFTLPMLGQTIRLPFAPAFTLPKFGNNILFPYFITNGQKISIPYFMTTVNRTSNSGYVISHNTIRNISRDGIYVASLNNVTITDNTIINITRNKIWANNLGKKDINNNTGFENSEDFKESNHPYALTPTAIIGTILIFLIPILPKILLGPQKISEKLFGAKIINLFSNWIHSIEDSINAVIRNSRVLTFIRSPFTITFVGTIIYGLAFAYATSMNITWTSFQSFFVVITSYISLLVISGIATVTPRAIQYVVAKKNLIAVEYRMWWGGIFVILITMVLPLNSIFGQPVKMDISNQELKEKRKILLTKLSGPITTILLSCGFYILYLGKITPFAMIGLQMCLLSSVVMLLPETPLEGECIWKWNKIIWGILFLPILIAYFISFLVPI